MAGGKEVSPGTQSSCANTDMASRMCCDPTHDSNMEVERHHDLAVSSSVQWVEGSSSRKFMLLGNRLPLSATSNT